MPQLDRRMRLAYNGGAEDGSLEATGRPMAAVEQDRVLERYRAE